MQSQAKRMSRADWNKTPYAGTQAQRTEEGIERLLARYGVREFSSSQGHGPSGRAAVAVRFKLGQHSYRICVETLWADVDSVSLLQQARRAVYYCLKSSLEMSSLFMPAEQVLFAYLELPGGYTMYEMAMPRLADISSQGFGEFLALPAPKVEAR